MMFFAESTMGFYSLDINDSMPADAISENEWEFTYDELMSAKWAEIVSVDGKPSLKKIEYNSNKSARMLRGEILSSTAWIIERHRDELEAGIATTLSAERYAELQAYRQQLRDWPAQPGWPDIDMPPQPEWLAPLLK
ncbi:MULTISPECIES: phage tail assembly chaperone [unclassified Aeromonas]|uniref:phage tail assembly chaperone n=1 Tax=unclassified Aeromonas TaxID=257493 RepID=UPI0022E5402C|nr:MULTISPECIES: phage tail assembly chaperone [unclassified Aeromonas]